MLDRHSLSKLQVVGGFAVIIGIIGYVVFGWRFGEQDGYLPLQMRKDLIPRGTIHIQDRSVPS